MPLRCNSSLSSPLLAALRQIFYYYTKLPSKMEWGGRRFPLLFPELFPDLLFQFFKLFLQLIIAVGFFQVLERRLAKL